MERKLYIEKWRPEAEQRDIKYEHVGYYLDKKTGIAVYTKKVQADLEVGQLYELTFEDNNDIDTYTYLILKRENDLYYMSEFLEGIYELYAPNPKYLGNAWVKCDIKETLEIDLSEWKDFKPNQNYKMPDMRKKIYEYISELDAEIERCEKVAVYDAENGETTISEMLLMRAETLLEVKNDLLSRLAESV